MILISGRNTEPCRDHKYLEYLYNITFNNLGQTGLAETIWCTKAFMRESLKGVKEGGEADRVKFMERHREILGRVGGFF